MLFYWSNSNLRYLQPIEEDEDDGSREEGTVGGDDAGQTKISKLASFSKIRQTRNTETGLEIESLPIGN